MKFSSLLAATSLLSGSAFASPVGKAGELEVRSPHTHLIVARQSLATKKKRTDNLLFNSSLSYFIKQRNLKNPKWLVWTSDGCSYVDDYPGGFPFIRACWRHDFGYRNYKKQNRFSTANKRKIDDKFLADMLHVCNTVAKGRIIQCYALATVYHKGVRLVPNGYPALGLETDPDLPGEEAITEEQLAADRVAYEQALAEWQVIQAEMEANGEWPIPEDTVWPADPEDALDVVPDWALEPEEDEEEPVPTPTATTTWTGPLPTTGPIEQT